MLIERILSKKTRDKLIEKRLIKSYLTEVEEKSGVIKDLLYGIYFSKISKDEIFRTIIELF